MPERLKRHKKPRTLNEPFRSFREVELAIERARASYCFFQQKVKKRSLRDIANEQLVTHERIRQLVIRAEKVYGLSIEDFTADPDIQIDVDAISSSSIMSKEVLKT